MNSLHVLNHEAHLPPVRGANLAREEMVFPRDFAGKVNLVFIAFQQWHQMQVDSWVPLVQRLDRAYSGLAFYEFPTIQRMNRFAQLFINEGMRAGIRDEATRARTITLYLDKASFKQSLHITDEDEIWLMLLDSAGRVLWQTRGAHDPEKGAALEAAVANAILGVSALGGLPV